MDRQRAVEQHGGAIAIAGAALAAPEFGIEIRGLHRQPRLFAARARFQRLQCLQAFARLREQALDMADVGVQREQQPGRRPVEAGNDQRFAAQQSVGGAIIAEPDAQSRDHAVEFGARFGLAREFSVAAHDAGVEQAAHVDAAGVGRFARVLEQADHEILHRLRARGLAQGFARLPGDDAERGGQHQQHQQRGRQRPAVPVHVLAQAVFDAVRTRLHRLAVEEAADVQRQRFDRGVAALRLFGQGLAHDVVDVARDLARELAQRVRAFRFRIGHALQRMRGTLRVGVQDRFLPLRVGRPARLVGLAAGEQFVQHHAERIHVGHGRDWFAADLFRRGVVQGEGAQAGAGVVEHGLGVVEQLGDAEVEQAHVVERGDQDVRRLQVAVHDQVRVRVADRVAGLQEQREPLRQRRLPLQRPVGDRFAVDVFQREVGLAVLGGAGIEQARDVGVLQPREDLPFAGEAQPQVGVGQAGAQQLQRDPALVQAVVAVGHPDLAHAAFAEQAFEPVRADARAGTRAGRGEQRFAQEFVVAGFLGEQRLEVVGGVRVFLAHQREAARTRVRVQLQQRVEQG